MRFHDLMSLSDERTDDRVESLSAQLLETQKELERVQLEQERLRASFRLFSHDLKAPVRAILQLAEWIHEDCVGRLPPDAEENLEMLRSRARRLEKMHRDLSSYIRCHQLVEQPPAHFDLSSSVAHAWKEVEQKTLGHYEFATDLGPQTRSLFGLQRLIETVLLNLLSNAVLHHDRDEGFVSVMARVEQDGALLVLRVEDDGPGIAPHLQEQALVPMKTLRSRDQGAGTGLGLPIVSSLIEALDGRFEMEYTFPSTSRGLRITCEIPLANS